MLVPIETIRLAEEPGLRWKAALLAMASKAATAIGVGDAEVANATQTLAEVTSDGHLHILARFPGGIWAEADVPWTQWSLAEEVLQ